MNYKREKEDKDATVDKCVNYVYIRVDTKEFAKYVCDKKSTKL